MHLLLLFFFLFLMKFFSVLQSCSKKSNDACFEWEFGLYFFVFPGLALKPNLSFVYFKVTVNFASTIPRTRARIFLVQAYQKSMKLHFYKTVPINNIDTWSLVKCLHIQQQLKSHKRISCSKSNRWREIKKFKKKQTWRNNNSKLLLKKKLYLLFLSSKQLFLN